MIGIDISQRSIKIVRLGQGVGRRLISHCWGKVPEGLVVNGVVTDIVVMSDIVKKTLKKCSISSKVKDAVVASIPETESFLRVVEVPPMDEEDLAEMVKWEVKQHIPFGLENVYIDWQSVPHAKEKRDKVEVLVGAAEKRVVDPLLATLSTVGLDVAALELESQAIVRSLISPELKEHKGLLIVDLGGEATNVVIHDQGTIRFTASLRKGAHGLLSPLSTDEIKAVTGPPQKSIPADVKIIGEKLQASLDALVTEVHGIVEFYTGLDPSHIINEILLTGGGSNLPGLDKSFLRYFENVHIQRGNPWVNVLPLDKNASLPLSLHESVHYSTALGLTLREVLI